MAKDWKVIHATFDLNERVQIGLGNHPVVIDSAEFTYSRRNDAIKKFSDSFKYFNSIAYDWKGHSMGALKFYYEKDGKELMTNVLLHYKGEEYDDIKPEELG